MKEGSLRTLSVCVVIAAAMLLSIPVGSIIGGVGNARAQPSTLTVGMAQTVDSLNPFIGYSTASFQMQSMMYDLLVAVDEDLNPTPGLADSWSHNVDGTVWTFNIRQGVTWHDGVPVTAEDIGWTYNLIINDPVAGALSIDYLRNVTDVRALDDYTLQITTEVPKATILSIIIPIVPKHLWMNVPSNKITTVDVFDTTYFPDGPIGSGPFRLVDYVVDDFVMFTKNADYWGGAVNFDVLIYKICSSAATMLNYLYAGTIDIAVGVPTNAWQSTLDKPNIDGQAVREITLTELGMNVCPVDLRVGGASTNYETLNLSVRQAVAMAVNKTLIVEDVMLGLADEASSLIPSASTKWHYNVTEWEKYNFDIDAANALLDAAGYIDIDSDGIRENSAGDAELSFRFDYIVDNPADEAAAYLIEDWLSQVGISAPPMGVSESTLLSDWISMKYDLYIWGWGGDADPSFLLSGMTTDQIPDSHNDWSAWSDCFYSNPYYDSLFIQQQNTVDVSARQAIVFEMQQILYHDAPYVVLHYPWGLYAYRTDRFENWPDMVSHPGMSPFADWTGGPWMYLEVRPITSNLPPWNVDAGEDTFVVAGETRSFTGYAEDEDPPSVLTWTWTFEEPSGPVNVLYGQTVMYTFLNEGVVTVTLVVTDLEGLSGSDMIFVTVLPFGARTVDYRWYDMFNVPFGEWWDVRWDVYHQDEQLTDSYPYIFRSHVSPRGHSNVLSNMRLGIAGRNLSELNMTERPEFLPFLGTERGGNATIDWYMQYATSADLARYPGLSPLNDGLITILNGTVTLDEQAAKAVINITDAGYDNFPSWWATNGATVETNYLAWLNYEGNTALDIYNMDSYPWVELYWSLDATKVGNEVVLSYDLVTWGMELLMTRWLRDAFMPTEWYFEDMVFQATIGPEKTNLSISTAVDYVLYAYETILVTPGHGSPCWAWEGMLQDYIASSVEHPKSDFDPYVGKSYVTLSPGSLWYDTMIPYDYTPGPFNLSLGERMTFEWPAGEQLFIAQSFDESGLPIIGETENLTGNMTVSYSEPMDSDSGDFAPGSVVTDANGRTITFTGPIDMWNWSRLQLVHLYLYGEWARLGVLPYGMPMIEFLRVPPENTPPTASFTFTPAEGNISTVFSFDASGSWDAEDSSSNLRVRWDWEDDGTYDTVWSLNKTAEHQFPAIGTYSVRLQVNDTGGLTNETTLSVNVVNTAPIANFTVVPASGDIATSFAFDASLSSDLEDALADLEVQWDWESDGTWDVTWTTTKTASHTYSAVDTYTVTLQVRDTLGLVGETTKTVVVENAAPVASFVVIPASGSISTVFFFNASSSSDLEDSVGQLEVRWDWTNDSTWDTAWSNGKNVSHQYTAVGTYTVKMAVRDTGGLENLATREVQVLNVAPVAALIVDPVLGDVLTTFLFDASDSTDLEDLAALLEVRWDWNSDGTWDTGWSTAKVASHEFSTAGTYTVTVEVRDSGGLTDTAMVDVEVTEVIPEFGSIVLPISAVLAMFVILRRKVRVDR